MIKEPSSFILPRIPPNRTSLPLDDNPFFLTRSLCFQDSVLPKDRHAGQSLQTRQKIWQKEYTDTASVRVNSYCRELHRSLTLQDQPNVRKQLQIKKLERQCKKLRAVEPSSREIISNARALVYTQLTTIDQCNSLSHSQSQCLKESKLLEAELEKKAKQEIKIKQDRTLMKESIKLLRNRATQSHRQITDTQSRLESLTMQRSQLQTVTNQQTHNIDQLKVYEQFVLQIFQQMEAIANNVDLQHTKLFENPSMLIQLLDFLNQSIIFSNKNIQQIIEQNIRLQKNHRKTKKKLDKQFKEKSGNVDNLKQKIRKMEEQIQHLRSKEVGLNKISHKSSSTETEIYDGFKYICIEFGQKQYARMQPLDFLKQLQETLDERLLTIKNINQSDSIILEQLQSKIILQHRGQKINEVMSDNVSPLMRPLRQRNRNSRPHQKKKGRPIISKMLVRKQQKAKSTLSLIVQHSENDKYFQA